MTEPPPDKLRVMLDANVLLAGTGWPRFPYEVLRHALKGDYVAVVSNEIVEDARKYIQAAIGLNAVARFDQFLIDANVEVVEDPTAEQLAHYPADLVRDPDDIAVAVAAMVAKVDYLISQDTDLTSPDQPVHQLIKIMLPGTFLREKMGWTSDSLEEIRHRTWTDLTNDKS